MRRIPRHVHSLAVVLLVPCAGQADHHEPIALDSGSPRSAAATLALTTGTASMDAPPASPGNEQRVEPADAATWVRLGDTLMQKSRESLDPRDCARAEEAYQQALDLVPGNVQALLGMAWVHNTEHEFEAGRRFAEAALEIDPELPEAHALLGDAAVELGDYDAAFDHYQEALDLRPDLSSYSRAAHLLWLTGDGLRARWLMQKAIDAGGPYPENRAWCRTQLALMSFHSGALIPAERQVQVALKEAPRNPQILSAAGRIKAAQKDYAAAIEFYRRSIDATPTHDALAALADLYGWTGRLEEAQAQFDRVLAFHQARATGHIHPHEHRAPAGEEVLEGGRAEADDHLLSHANYQLARFYADHDRHLDEALREAQAAWRAFPNVICADTLAWCLYKNGQYDEAEKMIRQALKIDTPDAAIHFHAGMIYAKLHNRPLAQKHLHEALSLNPHFHPAHAQLAVDTLRELSMSARPKPATCSPTTRTS